MNQELYEEATQSNILTKTIIAHLLESMNYSSISFINWTIEVLNVYKTRIERGDKIKDEVTGEVYTMSSFHKFVNKNFSSYIESQVFAAPGKREKVYFTLHEGDGCYNLIMADSPNEKTYEWISSLSERFSLVRMISTGIVYIKDIRTDTYQPFISSNGRYCRYDEELGQLKEV